MIVERFGPVTLVAKTSQAYLMRTETGKEVWFPKSVFNFDDTLSEFTGDDFDKVGDEGDVMVDIKFLERNDLD